jgi:hypothetical protein
MELPTLLLAPALLGCVLTLGAMTPLRVAPQPEAALPEEPIYGSIRVGDDESYSSMVKLAKLSEAQAQEAAIERSPGKIIETELEEEEGFLFWEVKMMANDGSKRELYIDAGNGAVVAIDRGD